MATVFMTLLPFAISVVVAVALGRAISHPAPGTRWIYVGLFIATLGVVHPDYDPWFRALSLGIGIALVIWDYRRHRVRERK